MQTWRTAAEHGVLEVRMGLVSMNPRSGTRGTITRQTGNPGTVFLVELQAER